MFDMFKVRMKKRSVMSEKKFKANNKDRKTIQLM